MSRIDAVARARAHLQSGEFLAELDRRVAHQTESQSPGRGEALRAYLEQELAPAFSQLDFKTRLIESPTGKAPYLVAEYRESDSVPTILMYGHGDVVDGMAGQSETLADDDHRQSRLWPRYRRQQGAAEHQSVGACRRARISRRPAWLQRQIHH